MAAPLAKGSVEKSVSVSVSYLVELSVTESVEHLVVALADGSAEKLGAALVSKMAEKLVKKSVVPLPVAEANLFSVASSAAESD